MKARVTETTFLHAAMGKIFNLPTILTASMENGREANTWDNPDFRAAVKATGKKQWPVCTALSYLEEEYEVFANSETHSRRIADKANDRMRAVGVNL
ncbi:hypothetical protein MPER_03471 [Moniliophthora perniciosa FA553]|nr:hypothetical protein MPER_03471 [Moniliophthora perniciosa FA553]